MDLSQQPSGRQLAEGSSPEVRTPRASAYVHLLLVAYCVLHCELGGGEGGDSANEKAPDLLHLHLNKVPAAQRFKKSNRTFEKCNFELNQVLPTLIGMQEL